MFSLQKLLGNEDRFFALLEGSGEQAKASVDALVKFLRAPERLKALADFVEPRRKGKAISIEISDALCTTFVTGLEREDIEALSNALYKIPKTVEKVAERVLLAPRFLDGIDISKQLENLEQAAEIIHRMLKELRQGMQMDRIRDGNEQLQAVEGEADKALTGLLRQLYSGSIEPVPAVFLKDIFELLEKVVDRCRDAGNVINHIALKNS